VFLCQLIFLDRKKFGRFVHAEVAGFFSGFFSQLADYIHLPLLIQAVKFQLIINVTVDTGLGKAYSPCEFSGLKGW
jgi:hypothetical protein